VMGLEILSTYIIPILFGSEFHAAIGITRVMLLASFFMSIKRVLLDCTRGMGRPDWGLRAEILAWLPLAAGFSLLGDSGAGMAWTVVLSSASCTILLGAQIARASVSVSSAHRAMSIAHIP
jgi:O-antigen/teichoic acid export membrane protein